MQFRKARRRDVAINIAPLVDVVFLLVIFFAVSTTFLDSSGLELELPSSSSTAERKPDSVTVVLDRDGQVWFNEEALDDRGALQPLLTSALEDRPDKMVVLRADESVEHGDVVALMDVIRAAGARGMTVAARSSDTP